MDDPAANFVLPYIRPESPSGPSAPVFMASGLTRRQTLSTPATPPRSEKTIRNQGFVCSQWSSPQPIPTPTTSAETSSVPDLITRPRSDIVPPVSRSAALRGAMRSRAASSRRSKDSPEGSLSLSKFSRIPRVQAVATDAAVACQASGGKQRRNHRIFFARTAFVIPTRPLSRRGSRRSPRCRERHRAAVHRQAPHGLPGSRPDRSHAR